LRAALRRSRHGRRVDNLDVDDDATFLFAASVTKLKRWNLRALFCLTASKSEMNLRPLGVI